MTTLPDEDPDLDAPELTPFAYGNVWRALFLALVFGGLAYGFPKVQRAFAVMFEDVGGDLPAVTEVILAPYWRWIFCVLAALAMIKPFVVGSRHPDGMYFALCLAGIFLFGLACVFGLFLPLVGTIQTMQY